MNMLGHDHPTNELNRHVISHPVQPIDENILDLVVSEQRQAAVTRKRKKTNLTGKLEPL